MRYTFTAIMGLMVITLFTLDTSAQNRRKVYIGSANGGVWKTNSVRRNIADGTSNTIMRNKIKDGSSNTLFSRRNRVAADNADGRVDAADYLTLRRRTETIGMNETISVGGRPPSSLAAGTYGRGVAGQTPRGITVDPRDRDTIY